MKEFLKSLPLFQGFSDLQIEEVLFFCKEREYKTGEFLIQEGEKGSALFILHTGLIEVVKGNLETQEMEHLSTLHSGEWVGDMALIEKSTSTASVRALTTSRVLIFSLNDFIQSKKDPEVSSQIIASLAKRVSLRLRKTNEGILQNLKEKLNMTRILVNLFVLLAFYLVIFKYIAKYNASSKFNTIASSSLILFSALAFINIIYQAKFPLEYYGVTGKKWLVNIRDGALLSIPVMIFGTFLKWVAIHTLPWAKGMPIVSLTTQGTLVIAIYILLIPIQEFAIRGILQSTFTSFFRGPNKILYAILTSNLIFEMFHNIKSISLSVLVFCLGIFWGFLFAQQKSLVGPIVSHIILGVYGFFFLGIERVLIY